ncbi:MAG: hypothetical protein HYU51_04040 [Candidatus Rokubacteria bacterium]|nr:hypothetical protein [Candidatus Rokubacteria bacterium]
MASVCALVASALSAWFASAQPQVPIQAIAADRSVIEAQIKAGLLYAEQAFAELGRRDEAALASAGRLAWESYTMMRFAAQGVRVLHAGRPSILADPLLLLAARNLNRAREMNIRARADIENSIAYPASRTRYLASATRNLGESLRIVRQAAELF